MTAAALTRADALALRRCLGAGGVAVFPADTVYGLACDHESPAAIARLFSLKGRQRDRPLALMTFSVDLALKLVPWTGPRTRAALTALMPGPVTVVLPDPEGRYAHVSPGSTPAPGTVGIRVPRLPYGLSALTGLGRAFAQSSANASGQPEARSLQQVDRSIAARADLALDGGERPGKPSTVVDLTGYEDTGAWSILRAGAAGEAQLRRVLAGRPRPSRLPGRPA